jgi:hypothetical protein
VISRERDGCLGGKLDLVRTFHGMYRWFSVVPQGLDVFSPVVLGGDFRSLLLVISLGCFRDLSLGDLMGEICGNTSWFFEL